MSKLTKELVDQYLKVCDALGVPKNITDNYSTLPLTISNLYIGMQEEEEWTPIGALASGEPFYVSVNSIVPYGAFCTLPDNSSALLHWTNLAKKGQGRLEFKEKIIKSLFIGKELEVRVVEINRKGQIVLNAVNKKKTNTEGETNV